MDPQHTSWARQFMTLGTSTGEVIFHKNMIFTFSTQSLLNQFFLEYVFFFFKHHYKKRKCLNSQEFIYC